MKNRRIHLAAIGFLMVLFLMAGFRGIPCHDAQLPRPVPYPDRKLREWSDGIFRRVNRQALSLRLQCAELHCNPPACRTGRADETAQELGTPAPL